MRHLRGRVDPEPSRIVLCYCAGSDRCPWPCSLSQSLAEMYAIGPECYVPANPVDSNHLKAIFSHEKK